MDELTQFPTWPFESTGGPFDVILDGPRRPWEAPRFFAWEAPHACGVTDRQERALDGVREALCGEPPGTVAQIRRVTVNTSGDLRYVTAGPIVTASVGPVTGVWVWVAA